MPKRKRGDVTAAEEMAPLSTTKETHVSKEDSAHIVTPVPSTKKGPRFRMRTKTLFLTYPCCPLEKEEALRQLMEKCPEVEDYIVARETHQSGDLHLHVYLRMKDHLSVKGADFLDLVNSEGPPFHGNYRSCRSQRSVQRYCTKEGDYISNMDLTEKAVEVWKPARALARQGKIQEAVDLLETKVSRSILNKRSTTKPSGTLGAKRCLMRKCGRQLIRLKA